MTNPKLKRPTKGQMEALTLLLILVAGFAYNVHEYGLLHAIGGLIGFIVAFVAVVVVINIARLLGR